MAATVKINRITGAGAGSGTDITSINTRANAVDSHSTGDTTSPIQVPLTPGTNYSFWVTTRLNVTVTPSGTINNLRWYTDGANNFGTGVTCKCAKASTGANAGYRQATGSTGTGDLLNTTNHTGLDEVPANAFTFTVGSPKSLTGSITNPSTGLFGDHLVYQIEVDDTAGPGATTQETFTWKYDET
jgi:hypothetical protein